MPKQIRGVPVADGAKIQNKDGAVKNRRALGGIGNHVSVPVAQGGKPQPSINRPITQSFCAQLLANGQNEKKPNNANENKAPVLAAKKPQQPLAQRAVPKKNLIIKQQPKKEVSPKKKNVTYSLVLSARSKVACGVTNKLKKIVDIDESDKDNHLAAVEYVEKDEILKGTPVGI